MSLRVSLLALVLLSSCGRSHAAGDAIADASAPVDASAAPDASTGTDAAVPPDASAEPDAARSADAEPADASAPDCEPQDARAVDAAGSRYAVLGRYRWTGLACGYVHYETQRDESGRPIDPPLGCEGDDCDALYADERDCVARYEACGAVRLVPLRAEAFRGAATEGVQCGGALCPMGEECSFEVVSRCRPADATAGRRLRCDDPEDCATTCCVGEHGPYLVSWCATECDPAIASAACTGDEDCAPAAAHCCRAVARYPVTVSTLGVCTPHACEPDPG